MTFPFQVFYHPSLPSTMDEARRMAADGVPEGTVVQAGIQTAGRGRFGNQWVSPEGNLYMTLVLRPAVPLRFCAQLSFVMAVALADTLAGFGIQDVNLKWPNDVLVSGKKIAGILLEVENGRGDAPQFLLVGMGVNIGFAPEGAARIEGEGCEGVRDALLENIALWYRRWLDAGFADIRARWLENGYGIGKPVRARMASGTICGIFEGLDADGHLLMLDEAGAVHKINSADVHFGAA